MNKLVTTLGGALDETGEAVGNATEGASQAANETGEAVGNATEGAANETGQAADNATEGASDAANETGKQAIMQQRLQAVQQMKRVKQQTMLQLAVIAAIHWKC